MDRPGPQPHNAGITPGFGDREELDLREEVENLKEICRQQAMRMDSIEIENRRLRQLLGSRSK